MADPPRQSGCSEPSGTPRERPRFDSNHPLPLRSLFRLRGSFADVDDASLTQLDQRMRPRLFHDGEIICDEGDPGDWAFVVAAGEVEVIKRAKDGTMILVNVLRPGHWGGMMSVFGQMPRSARLVARGDVELRTLARDDLVSVIEKAPSVATGLLACMGRRLHEDAIHLAATLRHVSGDGLEEFYARCSPQERLMLDTIRHRVAAAESLEELMEFLFDSIGRNEACDRMTLLFLEDDAARVVSYWTHASYAPLLLPADYKEDLAGSIFEKALKTGKPYVVGDLEQYAQVHPNNRAVRLLVEEGLRSSIHSPLVASGQTVGFLVHSARAKHAFGKHQALVHEAIARSISQPVGSAYRIGQLTQANKAYAEMLGFVSHELQSPIASMVTDAQLLAAGYLGDVNERQRAKLQRSVEKGRYLMTLVRDYLNLSYLEDATLRPNLQPAIDLCARVVEPAIERAEADHADKKITIERHYADPPPKADCDPAMIRIAVGNLLRNAIKYGREGGVIRVYARVEEPDAQLVVWNDGSGFAVSDRPKLFRKFSRLSDPSLRQQGGTGVGLYSTWRIMQLHGGRVAARSEQGQWAEFTLSFPVKSRQGTMVRDIS